MFPYESLKSGNEPLISGASWENFRLSDFWRWSVSDLVSNATRWRFAEFIVATALGLDVSKPRNEWGAYDLETEDGLKIEIKASGYVQSWHQKWPSKISFSIRPSRGWNPETGEYGAETKRQWDVYVFCLLKHLEFDASGKPDILKMKETVNPMDLSQWEFYVVPTRILDEKMGNQAMISLNALRGLAEKVGYEGIRGTVNRVFEIE